MRKLFKGLIIGGSALVAVGAGAGVATGIILPKALKAKDTLESFISQGGSRVDLGKRLAEKKALNVVALGDSLTAGYNSYDDASNDQSKDYYSYADFLVSGLQKLVANDEKINYKNYAKSGLRLADIKARLEDDNIANQLKTADLITLTIGSNDILALLKFFHIPYRAFPEFLSLNAQDLKLTTKDAILNSQKIKHLAENFTVGPEPAENHIRTKTNTGLTTSRADAIEMGDRTIQDIIDIANDQDGKFLNIDEDWVDKIFDLVERELTVLIRDLHKGAPNAQIVVLGASLPFSQFPGKVLQGKNPIIHNRSLLENFNKLLEKMKSGAKNSLDDNGFVDFFKMDELEYMAPYAWKLANFDNPTKGENFKKLDFTDDIKIITTALSFFNQSTTNGFNIDTFIQLAENSDSLDGEFAKKIKDIMSKSQDLNAIMNEIIGIAFKKYMPSVLNNPMPNITDIHPSIFGHGLIGKSLLKIYAERMGVEKAALDKAIDSLNTTPYNTTTPDTFKSENPMEILKQYGTNRLFHTLLDTWNKFPNQILDTLKIGLDQFAPKNENEAKLITKKMLEDALANLAKDNLLLKNLMDTNPVLVNKIMTTLVEDIHKLLLGYTISNNELKNNVENLSDKSVLKHSLYKAASFFNITRIIATNLSVVL